MGYKYRTKILFLMGLLVFILLLNTVTIYAAKTESLSTPQDFKAIRNSNTSIRIKWKPVPDADGYIIYKYRSSSKKYKAAKVIKDSQKNQWIDKKLRTNKIYTYKIAAYKTVNGKKQFSELSHEVSAKTYKRTEKLINAHPPKIGNKQITLGLKSGKQLKATVTASRFGKNKHKKPISKKVWWYSDNEEIATVEQNGQVTAGAKAGTCNVYAVAHNGTKTGTRVVVRNFAKEDDFYNYGKETDIYVLITEFKTQIQNIAEYYSINRLGEDEEIKISLNNDAELVIEPAGTNIDPIKKDVEKLLVDFPYDISISVSAGCVEFRSYREGYQFPAIVDFLFDDDCDEYWDIQIASHWTAFRYHPY